MNRCRWWTQTRNYTLPTTITNGGGRSMMTASSLRWLTLEGFQAGLSWLTILKKQGGVPQGF